MRLKLRNHAFPTLLSNLNLSQWNLPPMTRMRYLARLAFSLQRLSTETSTNLRPIG